MDISYLGKSAVKIRGKSATLITDATGFKVEVGKEIKKEISGPGEYEVGGISALSFKFGESLVYVFEVDGLRILYLGSYLGGLTDERMSQVGYIDILILDTGSKLKEAVNAVGLVDPYYVIPFSKKEPVETFLKETGLSVEKTDKFSVKKEEIIEDQTTKIILLPEK